MSNSQSASASGIWGCSEDIEKAFWQQWQQYQDYLYHCCIKWMGGNRTDAEDALSRAMLKAWEKVQKYAGEITNFKAWVTRLTHNLCVDIHRECSRGANRVEDIEGYASGEEQGLVRSEDTPEINKFEVVTEGVEKVYNDAENTLKNTYNDAANTLDSTYDEAKNTLDSTYNKIKDIF